MSRHIRLCHKCARRAICFPRGSNLLCDACIGEEMRLAAGIRKCKSCGRVTETDEFGDCKQCLQPAKSKRGRKPAIAAKGGDA